MSRRVLITGGSGFVGLHLCAQLRREGLEPVVFDRCAPRMPDAPEWIEGDVLDAAALSKAMGDVGGVFHLASILSVETTEKRPRDTLDVAILGTRNVCLAARPDQRIVLSSTSEVYGDAPTVPTDESAPVSPKGVYGMAKLACEQYVRTLPNFTVLRYFSVYGPGQAPGFVIPRFTRQAVAGEPITVYGDGEQIRAFCHVADIARGSVAAYRCAAAAGATYNIGNPAEPVTMNDLARLVIAEAASTSCITHITFEKSDRTAKREIYRRIPDITAARNDLGYAPRKNLKGGLDDVIRSLKE
ncbi:MAG: NAD-dependent epimerase/dehydratase family protein [Candidatus Thermoplasmatota archaeon]